MPDIFHQLPIEAPLPEVFEGVSDPESLNAWWTKRASGEPVEGGEYTLHFGPDYDWRAVVTRCVQDEEFELRITEADEDWVDTRVGFRLDRRGGATRLRFHHLGWREANEHFRVSSFCWAMYLRLLKHYLERGELLPYEERLEA